MCIYNSPPLPPCYIVPLLTLKPYKTLITCHQIPLHLSPKTMSLTLTLSSDTTVKQTTTLNKPTIYTNKNRFTTGSRTTNPKTHNAFPAEFLRRIAEKMAKTLSLVTIKRSSRKVSSSATLARSRSCVDTTLDTHRAEAVSDCIEFLNSSSVLRKCNSVS